MAAERLPMRKLREIIRLKLQAGQSGRAIARACGLSPSTINEYVGRIALAGLKWPLAPELDDDVALERLLFPDEGHPVSNRPEPDWIYVHRELQRRHVTKMLLWQLPDVNYFSPLTTTTLPHRLSSPTAHSGYLSLVPFASWPPRCGSWCRSPRG